MCVYVQTLIISQRQASTLSLGQTFLNRIVRQCEETGWKKSGNHPIPTHEDGNIYHTHMHAQAYTTTPHWRESRHTHHIQYRCRWWRHRQEGRKPLPTRQARSWFDGLGDFLLLSADLPVWVHQGILIQRLNNCVCVVCTRTGRPHVEGVDTRKHLWLGSCR